MRITNRMITNNMLININRNQNMLNKYDIQISTGKKIQRPSDDPIIAVRALRFRTTVSEINQYRVNCQDAISWCDVSEQAASNVIDISKRIRDLSVQSSSDVLNVGNRKKIVDEMKQLKEQFLNEVNASYAGRYIFSGFKTSTPAVFDEDTTDVYEINQSFKADDVEKVKRVNGTGTAARVIEVNRLRLGYSDITNANFSTNTGLTDNFVNSTDATALTPPAGTINILQDTGEIIINDADLATLPNPIDITYRKDNFKKMDLVPQAYFNCENVTQGVTYNGADESMEYQISYSQMLRVNSVAEDIVPVDLQRDIEEIISKINNIEDNDSLDNKLKADILGEEFSKLLGKMDAHIDTLLKTRAEIGGKINRLNLTINRLSDDELNFTDILSKNEDIDYAETYTRMSSMESVYRASLSATGKVIQPTLLDFIR